MSLLPVFPTLENLLGACLSHERVGSFLALFSCLNFNFLSAWAQFCELKCIEQPPTGGRSTSFTRLAPREPAGSAHRSTHNIEEFFNVSFSSTTSFGTADSHLVFIWSLRLVNHRAVTETACVLRWVSIRSENLSSRASDPAGHRSAGNVAESCRQNEQTLHLSQKGVKPPWLLNLLLPIMTCAFL